MGTGQGKARTMCDERDMLGGRTSLWENINNTLKEGRNASNRGPGGGKSWQEL